MESFLKLLEQLQGMVGAIDELKLRLDSAEASLAEEKRLSFEEGSADGFGKGKAEGDAEGYARGFDEGVKSVPPVEPPVSDKVYSQEELDAAISNAVGPLQLKINELEASINEIPQMIENAKREVKNEIMAKYLEAQSSESESEKSFEEFLK